MTDVDREDPFEVSSIHDQDPVETLAAYSADPSFDERVRAGCPYWRADCPDALGAEHLVERRHELAVAIVDAARPHAPAAAPLRSPGGRPPDKVRSGLVG